MASYWTQAFSYRARRRTLLTGAGGAALLIACGGGSSTGDKSSTKVTGLVSDLIDTTKQGKRGGTLKDSNISDARTFDPHIIDITARQHDVRAYQTLLKTKPTSLKVADNGVVEGDAAESWEISPDKLTITMKLRPGNKWDARSPTNSRPLDADDVTFAWKRYEQMGSQRNQLSNNVAPAAPIVSMTASDKQTVIVKAAMPFGEILPILASTSAGYFFVLPKELDGGFDIRREQRGSGPWWLADYQPSVSFTYKRNDNYWDSKNYPLIDTLIQPIVPEYATGLAQLKTGNIYSANREGNSFTIKPEDIVQTKKEVPQLNLVPTLALSAGTAIRQLVGFQDGPKSPFRDVRMRQAIGMAYDRDLFIDTFHGVSNFAQQGVDVATGWNSTTLVAGVTWWLDPKSKEFGENAKFFKHDLQAAKQLISAAGYPNGVDFDSHHVVTPEYGADFPKRVEVYLGMIAEAGLRGKITPADWNTDWRPKYADAHGNFDGLSFRVPSAGPGRVAFFSYYNSKADQFYGFTPDGKSTFAGDPYLEDLTTKILAEFDPKTVENMVADLQRYDGKMQYTPYLGGAAGSFALAWPCVQNFGVWSADPAFKYIWLDQTKAPIGQG